MSILNDHEYPTNVSQSSFNLQMCSLNTIKHSIFNPGPKLWNDVINKEEKDVLSYYLFQKKIKGAL